MDCLWGLFGRNGIPSSDEEGSTNITESTNAVDASSTAQREPKDTEELYFSDGPTGFKVLTDPKDATLEYRPPTYQNYPRLFVWL
jgi:hypothetical protein